MTDERTEAQAVAEHLGAIEQPPCWSVDATSYLRNLDADDRAAETFAIHYQRPPVRNANGTTTFSLRVPAFIVCGYLSDQRKIAERAAAILNNHWDDVA